ncbi:poly-gamma-glutamate hydrolase family protein [Streptomyces mirabilis]|uniref:poly-gamma-glutamate hydrolase family protein n=1 Tax=Streptomyces mirabilis TaxID=68239 RepID=UPI00225486B7|nr:poly-gamma-glutamate hydrolase family protein [Streptomyces mirabilis]MCX4421917.1 poly-gamma-glutamate hydrolase family protein [Streptomyces mirabilis]
MHDFWMFEGLMSSGNGALHVTSTHCDDTIARSLCAGSLNALSLHGCSPEQAGLESGAEAVLIGGLNPTFRQYLLEEFTAVGIRAVTASGEEEIAGISPDNICNRTLLGMGAQLEMTTALRTAMFAPGKNTIADRATNLLPSFWTFTAATRRAIDRVEAGPPSMPPPCGAMTVERRKGARSVLLWSSIRWRLERRPQWTPSVHVGSA